MHAGFIGMRAQLLCRSRPFGKLSFRDGLQPAPCNILLVCAGIGLLDGVILQTGSELAGRANYAAGLVSPSGISSQ